MSKIFCTKCGESWEGSVRPLCPECLSKAWIKKEDLIKPKHDPGELHCKCNSFRSVVNPDFVNRKDEYCKSIANEGTCFYNTKEGKYDYLIDKPSDTFSGSAVLEYTECPSYPLLSTSQV
jgi:hypothetical protein